MNGLSAFKLAEYINRNQADAKYLLSTSDAESLKQSDLLKMADDECKALWEDLSCAYTDLIGHPLLVKEVAKLYDRESTSGILMCNPQEAIYIGMCAIIEKLKENQKTHVITVFPAFQALYEFVRKENNIEWETWKSTYNKTTGWNFHFPDLYALVKDSTGAIIVNFPHNPTGFIPSDTDWIDLLRFCDQRGIILMSDEIYRYPTIGHTRLFLPAWVNSETAVTLSGLSKSFGLPGLRTGWLCTKNKQLMKSIKSYKNYITICGSAPAEILSIIALRNRAKLLERTRKICTSNLEVVEKLMRKHSHVFEWIRPLGGTTAFVKIKQPALALFGGTASEFCTEIQRHSSVMLIPASQYEYDDSFIRIGFGRADLSSSVEHLDAFLSKKFQDN